MKTVYQFFNDEIFVKYEDDNYVLKPFETLSDLSNFCRPKIENSEVIETATHQELSEWQQEKALQQMQEFKAKVKADGQSYYNDIDVNITMQLFGQPAEIVNPAVAELDATVMPVMNLVKDGQWYSALVKVAATTPPTNDIALGVWNEIATKIQSYVEENYR